MTPTSEMRPLIVGENNPYGSEPEFALYPLPERSAGGRLCSKVLGLTRAEYLRRFDRVNLLAQAEWSAPMAARAATALLVRDGPFVLCGAKVATAFGVPFRPFTICEVGVGYAKRRFAVIPHPSGISRAWNEPGAYERARKTVMVDLLGGR